MPMYEYRCSKCHSTTIVDERGDERECATCRRPAKRRWGFHIAPSMPDHWNPATGTYVSNMRQFGDDLKRQSEAATLRTGIDHDFQPVSPLDMSEVRSHGGTEEGLDITRRTIHDELTK